MNVEQITAEIQENGVALLKADESVSKLLLSHGNVVRSRSPREKVKASASKLSQARQSLTALKQAGVQLDKDRTKAVRDAEAARKARAEAYVDDRMPDAIERLRLKFR